jgi:hypothetical protein
MKAWLGQFRGHGLEYTSFETRCEEGCLTLPGLTTAEGNVGACCIDRTHTQ